MSFLIFLSLFEATGKKSRKSKKALQSLIEKMVKNIMGIKRVNGQLMEN